jgi:hypothetical protein
MINGGGADADALWDELGLPLAATGSRLSEVKTRVCHREEGFDLLGLAHPASEPDVATVAALVSARKSTR